VYVNGQMASRKGEYFRRELSVNNAGGPVWLGVTVTSPGEPTVTGNLFVPRTPEVFTHDLDGNLTSDGRWTNTWDAENRLLRVQSRLDTPQGSWRRVEWQYDALGRRIRQITSDGSSGTWVVAEDLKLVSDPVLFGRHIAELRASDNALVRSYVWGLDLSGTMGGACGVGGLLWVTLHTASGPAAGTHFVAYDGNGNVMALFSATTGTDTARYEYGPFGEPIRITGPVAALNPFRFSTKRTDNTTDLVLYEYRVYSPTLSRWPNRDPLGEPGFELLRGKKPSFLAGGPNKHLFVQNNPVSIIDPLGLWQWGWPPWGNKKKDEKCCEKKDAWPYKDLADKFLTDLAAKVQEAEAEIGRAKVADILDKRGKPKFAIDSIKSICDAKNPDGCDEFLKSGALVDCLLCCTSIHGLFSDELAGLGFSITCKFACRHAD